MTSTDTDAALRWLVYLVRHCERLGTSHPGLDEEIRRLSKDDRDRLKALLSEDANTSEAGQP